MKKTDAPVIVKATVSSSLQEVWKAITQQPLMIQWFFEGIPAFEARVGFSTRFDVTTENHTFPHVWTILEVMPHEKIVYDWRYDGFEGVGEVSFELSSTEGGTLVSLTSVVIEDFQEGVEEFSRASCAGGWEYFIQDRLVAFLAQ